MYLHAKPPATNHHQQSTKPQSPKARTRVPATNRALVTTLTPTKTCSHSTRPCVLSTRECLTCLTSSLPAARTEPIRRFLPAPSVSQPPPRTSAAASHALCACPGGCTKVVRRAWAALWFGNSLLFVSLRIFTNVHRFDLLGLLAIYFVLCHYLTTLPT